MSTQYKPGTVAKILPKADESHGDEYLTAVRTNGGGWFTSRMYYYDDMVEDVCLLVVLDLREFDSQPETIVRAFRRVAAYDISSGELFHNLAEEIKEQLQPPRPDAPKNLLSVVKDGGGSRWFRWAHDSHTHEAWAGLGDVSTWDVLHTTRWEALLAPIEVLSEGVPA